MTKDGIAFCANTIDLLEISTALPKFMARSSSVPELQPKNGIFSFDLTWTEIQTLKRKNFLTTLAHIKLQLFNNELKWYIFPFSAQMVNPFGNEFQRNPANKNNGKFVTLPEFLDLAKTKAVFGILIHIQVSNIANSLYYFYLKISY